jgi:hypothetical protein
MRTQELEQAKKLLERYVTLTQTIGTEEIIAEAKGRISVEPGKGFWEEKTPCWEMFHCPDAIRSECPAYIDRSAPCWEIEGTYCKLCDYGKKGDATDVCQCCRVYKRWGNGKPIELKIFGKGLNLVGKT